METELTVRVAYIGRDKEGKMCLGLKDVSLSCEHNTPVEDVVAAAKSKAVKELNEDGYYNVIIGSLYSARHTQAVA